MSIELGPFKLIQPIGKGGMGVVWQGLHTGSGIPVAVKVITQRVSRDARTLKAFRNEVRAVAGLNHPHIVWVLDYGEVSQEASIESGRQLTEGSPYLVMEMATGGTLSSFQDGLPWEQLRSMLINLLDALAHAHARGVIHRDLKPGNILLCSEDDLRPGLKLTDFGIAHAREETVSDSMSNHVIGTLHYMAPEQIRADWRDYGPWTDLYALGTIAYRLASGRLPFKGKRGASLMVAQLNHRPPPLEPIYPVPDGFEDWLLTMLRKEHYRRFQCAADAALALAALPAPRSGRRAVPSTPPAPVEEPVTALVLVDDPRTVELLDDGDGVTVSSQRPLLDAHSPEAARRRGELDRLRPAVPTSWRRPAHHQDGGIQLRGAGLGLWGLRAVELVEREEERDRIWNALVQVMTTRQSHAVVVRGPPGCGKSALVRWIAERAVEVGAAHLFRIDHAPDVQPHHSLCSALRKFFKVVRLDPEQRRRRVIEVCDAFGETDEADAARLEGLLDTDAPVTGDVAERHRLLRWFFNKLATDRTLLLWVEDGQYGMDTLQLVQSLLKTGSSRILAVITVDDDALAERRVEHALVDAIAAHPRATALDLGPLSREGIITLARDRFGLEPELAEALAEQARGFPHYVTQVVGEWIAQDALERGPEGYALRSGMALPRSLTQVWSARIAQITAGLPEDARVMLELAAVLGETVDEVEWARLCDDPDGHLEAAGGAPLEPEHVRWRAIMVDRLLSERLAAEQDDGWRFVEGDLREALLEQARREGRLEAHHGRTADMLRRTGAPPERLGLHLVRSGDLDAGIEALLDGVDERLARVGPRAALALLEHAEVLLDEASIPATDPRRGRIGCAYATLAIQRGRLGEALKRSEQVLSKRGPGWRAAHASALFVQANVFLLRKRTDDAREAFIAFHRLAPREGFALHRAAMHHALSLLAEAEGDGATARDEAERAAASLHRAGATLLDTWKLFGTRGLVAARAGTLVTNLERRRNAYAIRGQIEGVAECWMVLAAAARKGRRTPLAERCLHHAARLFDDAASPQAHRARLQIALLRAAAGDYPAAEQHAVDVANQVRDAHRKPVLLRAHAILAVCAAGRERWKLTEDHLEAIEGLVALTGLAEKDIAWALSRTAELARRAGHAAVLRRAAALAMAQAHQLGDSALLRKLAASIPT